MWGFLISTLWSIVQMIPAFQRFVAQLTNSGWRNEIPDVYTLADMFNKNIISEERFVETLGRHGIAPDYAEEIKQASKQYLSAVDYMTLFRRGHITWGECIKYLQLLKLDEAEVMNVKRVTEFFPSPADLITFAVREVYTPEIVEKFGQMEDLPEKFLQEAAKAGLPEEQARNSWAAHWQLPSILQGFEMLHRRVIDNDTLQLLLRALDVMPWWRDKLTAISYNPLTRVDVRRMYGLGVLDEQGVKNAYLDIGYNEKNAELMTQFTILYENQETSGITRSSLISAYRDNLIDRDQLIAYFAQLGYSQGVIDFWLSNADYEKTLDYVKKYTDDLIDLFTMGAIDLDYVRNELYAQDLPAKYVELVIQNVLLASAKKIKVPSKAELETWLRNGVIDENYYVGNMRLLGYRDRDIQLYLTDIARTVNTAERHFLADNEYVRWLKSGIMSTDDFIQTMTDKGLSDNDIQKYIREVGLQSENTETT